MKMSDADLATYYRKGVGDTCHVCNTSLLCELTDYHGQGRCFKCGMTYQTMGSHLTDEFLTRTGLKKEEVAKRYCDEPEVLPLVTAYWNETGQKVPFGCYLSGNRISKQERDGFYIWLAQNADRFEADYADFYNWPKLKEYVGGLVATGEGI